MKNKKILASILSLALMITSFGVDAMAMAPEQLKEDVLVENDTALIDEGSESLIEENGEDLLIGGDLEDADVLSAGSVQAPLQDNDEIEDITLDRRDATPFDETSPVLTLKGYSSLKEWDFDSVVIPACVTTIPASEDLFIGNEKIHSVEFENYNTLTTIEAGAFLNSGITNISLPRSLKEIDDSTFQGCKKLASISLAEVESIGAYAFKDCTALTSAGISGGSRVTEIGDYAFSNTGFTTLALSGMTKAAISVGEGIFAYCRALVKAELPSGFITVPEKCFDGCDKLTEVRIGSKTVSVEKEAFKDCIALKKVNFSNVEAVRTNAFDGCSAIETIDLPESVFEIEENAFSKCDKLTKLYIRYYNKKTGYADDIELTGELVYYPSKLTIYGYGGEVEKYATGRNIKYESLIESHTVKLADGMSGYVTSYYFGKSGSSTTGTSIKASKGESVSLRLKTSGWVIINVYDSKDEDQETVIVKHIAGSDSDNLFSFEMPDRDVDIKFDVLTSAAISESTFTYALTGYGSKYEADYKDGKIIGYRTATTGNKAQIVVYANYKGTPYKLGTWLCKYKSYDPKIVSVTDGGVLTAIGAGQVYLSFTPTGSREQAFVVSVTSEPVIDAMEFDLEKLIDEFDDARYGEVGTVERNFIENGESVKRTVPIIKYYKADVNSVARKFDLYLLALDKGGAELNVKASWSVDDKKIATLANSSNYDNKNTVTIQKGTSGETYVKASVTTNNVTKYAYAVVQVLNPAPRPTRDSYMVNVQSTYVAADDDESLNSDGAVVELIASEGYDIDPEAMAQILYTSESVNETSTFKGVKITYIGKSEDHERGYLYRMSIIEGKYGDSRVNTLKEGKFLEFKDKTQLYMRGQFADKDVLDGLAGKYFYVPLKSLVIFNQKLNPKIAQSGSINIFYNSTCYAPEEYDFAGWEEILGDKAKKDTDDEDFEKNKFWFVNSTIGEVVITQSIAKNSAEVDYDGVYRADEYGDDGNKEIRDYVNDIAGSADAAVRVRLISEPNYIYFTDNTKANLKEKKDGKYFDSFANNFTVFRSTNGKDFRIRRSENEMAKINGQDVTNGYLLIYYKGYKNPIAYKLKLNIKNQGPSYVLSPSAVNDNRLNYSSGTDNTIVFEPGLFTKKNAKSVLQEDDIVDGYPYIDQELSTRRTGCVFNKEVEINKYRDTDTNVFNIVKNQTCSGKSKAVIVLKKTWWDKELKYTYSVNESDKNPTGKFSSSKLGLNRQFVGENTERSIKYTVNMGPCTVDGDFEALPAKNQDESEFDKLTVTCESEGPGTSSLLVKAYVNDGSIAKGNYVYVIYPTAEYAGGSFSLKPARFTVNVVDTQPTLKLTTTSYNFNIDYPGVETYKVNASFGSVPKGGKNENFELNSDSAELVPTAKEGTEAYYIADFVKDSFNVTKFAYNEKTKKFDFFCKLDEVPGYQSFNCSYNLTGLTLDGAELKPLRITLKSHHGAASVTVTGTGSINSVDKWSYMTIKPLVKNLVNPDIADISYVEWDSEAGDYVTNDRFAITRETDEDKDTTLAYITATHSMDVKGKDTCTDANHKVILKYQIGDHSTETAPFNIKPIQTTSVLSVDPESATFYNNSEPDSKVATIQLTKTTVLNAVIDAGTENGGFKISEKKNTEELRRAFTVEYSDDGAEDVPASKYATKLKAGQVVIRCVAPELLTAGKTYSLVLEPEWEGQFEKSTANTVTVRVMVR